MCCSVNFDDIFNLADMIKLLGHYPCKNIGKFEKQIHKLEIIYDIDQFAVLQFILVLHIQKY